MKRIDENMHHMIGKSVPLYFKICWYFTTPLLLVVTISFAIYSYAPPVVGSYIYPSSAEGLGWCVGSASHAPIPLYMLYQLSRTPGTLGQRLRTNLKPNEKWGPQNATPEVEMITLEELCSTEKTEPGEIASGQKDEAEVLITSYTGQSIDL